MDAGLLPHPTTRPLATGRRLATLHGVAFVYAVLHSCSLGTVIRTLPLVRPD
jgi:hypothetical protein